MEQILAELTKLSPGALAAISAGLGAVATIVAALFTAILGKFLVTPFLSARDKQDREVEWRKHAIELTKLDLERKLKSGRDFSRSPLRPSILDFLANYRDLQELGTTSPKALYTTILASRVKSAPPSSSTSQPKANSYDDDDG